MSVMRANKLVPSIGTYLCSMQGYMCRIATLEGKSPLGKIGNQAAKDIKLKVSEACIRLKKAGKAHDNAITTWHKGVLRE